jgi:nucleoside phosphorylase
MTTSPRADVLLVTCNENELAAVRTAFSDNPEPPLAHGDSVAALDYGSIGTNRVLHVHTRQGSDSAIRVQRAVATFNPVAVLAVGICWGARDEDKDTAKRQRIGDVLVARQIKDTSAKRLKDGLPEYPGPQANSSGPLFEALQTILPEWLAQDAQHNRADCGLLISESTLFNDKTARDAVAQRFSALGGEMECEGIMRWAHELKVDWLLVKAICDWGYNKQSPNKEAAQQLAARQAASLVRHFVGRTPIGAMLRKGSGHSGAPESAHASGGNQNIYGNPETVVNAPGGTVTINLTRHS